MELPPLPYKGPCTQIVDTLAPKYLYGEYFKGKVYTIWVHTVKSRKASFYLGQSECRRSYALARRPPNDIFLLGTFIGTLAT